MDLLVVFSILYLLITQLSQSRPGATMGHIAQIVTINGQQHILVPKQQQQQLQQQPQQIPATSTAGQSPSPVQSFVVTSSAASSQASPIATTKIAAGGGGFIVVRPPVAQQQQQLSSSAGAATTSIITPTSVSGAPCVVQTAGGSIILQQPVNPTSAPQQPIIASVRLPNGQTQQILLNTQQVVAHQQLAALQAMSPTATNQHRLIAPSPKALSVVSVIAALQ